MPSKRPLYETQLNDSLQSSHFKGSALHSKQAIYLLLTQNKLLNDKKYMNLPKSYKISIQEC